jgi:DNA polymerase-3 subunit epsilon
MRPLEWLDVRVARAAEPQPRTGRRDMNTSSSSTLQLGLGFDDLPAQADAARPQPRKSLAPPALAAAAAPVARPPVPGAPGAPGAPGGTGAPDWEHMAQALDSHPDFRVLRRLVPPLMFPAPARGQTLRVLLLDTETTGLSAARDKVIELALLAFDLDLATGEPAGLLEVYDGLEDPGVPLSPEVQQLTGITNDMLRGQRLDEARIAQLLAGAQLVIAHNAAFDRPFVEARLPVFAELDWACSFAEIDWKGQGRDSAKLSALAMQLGWFYDAHRAEMDCHALLAVLRPPLPLGERNGLMHLVEAARRPSFRLQATGAPFEAKDLLKARNYRWDSNLRVWFTQLRDEAALLAETQWLKAQVYAGRPARAQVEQLDARQRYSGRPGRLDFRPL